MYYIIILVVYIILSWQSYKEEYQILEHLQDIFHTISILILSTKIAPN